MRKNYIIISALLLFSPLLYAQTLNKNPQEEKHQSTASLEHSQKEEERISLEIKGMNIIDALKMFSMMANLNIVAGKNVKGKVTLFLKDVKIMDAFEVLLVSNGLAYEEKNGIINVMTESEYEALYGRKFHTKANIKVVPLKYAKASDLLPTLNQAKSKIGRIIANEASNTLILIDEKESLEKLKALISQMDLPTETRIFSLNYTKAEEIKNKISERLTKGLGVLQIDKRTNKIIVTDLKNKMPLIEKIVKALDQRPKQVFIDAKIIEIALNKEYKLGVNWDAVFAGIHSALGSSFKVISGDIIPATSSTSATGGALRIGELGEDAYEVVLKAFERLGKTYTLSSPRITVSSNQEAKIMVGTNQPYATSTTSVTSTGNTVSYQITYLDLGIKLSVTPTVAEDKFVTLKINQEISSKTGDYTYGEYSDVIPVVETSQVETTVTIKDGVTIVIAGLIRNKKEEEIKKFPILGDIPILGWLFKSKQKGSEIEPERKELVIFLTPHIVSGDIESPEVKHYNLQ